MLTDSKNHIEDCDDEEIENHKHNNIEVKGPMQKGHCKWFNVVKGFGFITPDDGSQEVFVHQSVINMPGFRSLAENEEVEFQCKPSDKGLEATVVTGPQGELCKGSQRRPVPTKKKHKKIRCYNCGEFANHIAAKCAEGPQPKRCHNCKAEDHLIADCPTRPARNETTNNHDKDNNNVGSSTESTGSSGAGLDSQTDPSECSGGSTGT